MRASRLADALWQPVTLWASQTITASANATTTDLGWARQALLLFNLTDASTDVGDTLDVYVDISPDGGTTWINAVHFPQVAGNASAQKHWFFLNPEDTGVSTVNVTTDAASGVGRQIGLTDRVRVRAVVAPDADPVEDQDFTFSVDAFFRN